MSLEVKSNKELKKLKSEIFMGLGIREITILSVAGIAVFALFMKLDIPVMILCYITAPIIAAATLFIAFKPCGMYPEKFVAAMIRSFLINNRKLKYKDEKMEGVVKNVAKSNRKKGLHKS